MINFSDRLVCEFLKVVFFIVSALIVYPYSTPEAVNWQEFYKTFFIFDLTAWLDFLSELDAQSKQKWYLGDKLDNSKVYLVGSIVGAITVIMSMFCLLNNSEELINIALLAYFISLVYVPLKIYIIYMMCTE